MREINKYFEEAIEKGASDVHLVGGEVPLLRIHGELTEIDDKPLNNKDLAEAIYGIISKERREQFEKDKELDFAHELDDMRFRVNLHYQMDNIGLAARLIPSDIPTPDDLRFTEAMIGLTDLQDGLVLVTGATGSGKSTTLACLIEEINKKRKAHIVTIEDPVEFIFKDKKCLIEQREVGRDTNSFAAALKYVLRQDPNIILVGEMRDPETISTVLTAAETGHLVFSTLHTSSAAEAVERIVDVFEGSKQKQVLIQLSSVLRAVLAQQLVPAKGGGLIPAREILINNSAVANLIRENNISQIKSAIQTGAKEGMLTMENCLQNLADEGLVEESLVAKRTGRNKKI